MHHFRIERTVREHLMTLRSRFITRWNRHCTRKLYSLLQRYTLSHCACVYTHSTTDHDACVYTHSTTDHDACVYTHSTTGHDACVHTHSTTGHDACVYTHSTTGHDAREPRPGLTCCDYHWFVGLRRTSPHLLFTSTALNWQR